MLADTAHPLFVLIAYAVTALLVTAAVGVLVRFVAVRVLGDEARARQLSRATVWVLLLVFILTLIGRLTGDTAAIRLLFALPNVVTAVLLVVLGVAVAPALRGLVHGGLSRVGGGGFADIVAPLTYWLVIGLAVLLAADQLGIETGFVQRLVLLLFGGLVVALALALGLGTRDLIGAIVAGRHVAAIIAVGDVVEVDGRDGTVVALGHASVRLAQDGMEIEVPNTRFLHGTVVIRQRAATEATQQPRHP